MPADSFDQLDAFLGRAVDALSPAARKTLFRHLVREVRKRNQQRITKQVGPDGKKWEPRKRRRDGRVRSDAKMMLGLRAARRMEIKARSDGAAVGYYGSVRSQIAAVHQFGRVDKVDHDGPTVDYPARPLLGLAAADQAWIRNELMDHIAGAWR